MGFGTGEPMDPTYSIIKDWYLIRYMRILHGSLNGTLLEFVRASHRMGIMAKSSELYHMGATVRFLRLLLSVGYLPKLKGVPPVGAYLIE